MRFIIAVGFLIISIVGVSQTRIDSIFERLPEGGLLVRLKTNENALKALRGKDDELANKIIAQRDKNNVEIVEAFKGFTYSSVYFFYSSDSRKIMNREFENVLLDFDLNPLPDTLDLNENYLVATFDYTKKDTGKYYMNSEYRYVWIEKNGEYKGERKRVDVYGSTSAFNTGVDALILMSPELVPLQPNTDIGKIRGSYVIPYFSYNRSTMRHELMYSYIPINTRKADSTSNSLFFHPNDFMTNRPHYVRTFERWPFIGRSRKRTVELLQFKLEKYVKQEFKR